MKKTLLSLSLIFALNQNAMAMIVEDPVLIGNQLADNIKSYAQMMQDYAQQVLMYKQMLVDTLNFEKHLEALGINMSEWTEKNQIESDAYSEGYDDGYDACKLDYEKYHWHDLRKNPEDLPKEGMVIIATDGTNYFGGKIFNRHAGVSFETILYKTNDYRRSDESYIEGSDLIAWAEIELFEKVE